MSHICQMNTVGTCIKCGVTMGLNLMDKPLNYGNLDTTIVPDVVRKSDYDQLLADAMKLRNRVVEYAESGCIEAFHADKDSLSDAIDDFNEKYGRGE